MAFAAVDPSSIPMHRLAHRRLRLGPFGSGRDLVKFLCIATVGATVAAVSSPLLWLPFLAVGGMIAFIRVEGQTLDDFALGYCRFQWRSSVESHRDASGETFPWPPASSPETPRSIRAGGIPIAYLPPQDLQHLFEGWRSALASLSQPVSCRMTGEHFSPLPFLPYPSKLPSVERGVRDSYRELVRYLLRQRYRRVVELSVWNETSERGPNAVAVRTQVEELIGLLERLGIPSLQTAPEGRETGAPRGAFR